VAEQALLGGLMTCASCGHKLRVSGTTYKGQRRTQYLCVGHYAPGDCEAPAVALASLVDQHVAQLSPRRGMTSPWAPRRPKPAGSKRVTS
jgi:hypothetical protein